MDVSLWEASLCTPLSHYLCLYHYEIKSYSSSSSSSATAATVDAIVEATTITTAMHIIKTNDKNVKMNPSGVIISSPISPQKTISTNRL